MTGRALLVVLLLAPGARAAPEPEPEREPTAASAPTPVPTTPAAQAITLRRPIDCTPAKRRVAGRVMHQCARAEEVRAWPASEAAVLEPLGVVEAPSTVPGELLAVHHTCEPADAEVLAAAPDRFLAYEDPLVGPCWLWAPLDQHALDVLGLYDRKGHLATLHPYLAAAMRRALATASAAGHRFRVISGLRPGDAGWHTYGLAVDVQIDGRTQLGEATAAYLAGGPERAAWEALGAAGERLGLIWLGRSDPKEIFHFEWHPGWPGMPRGALAAELAADVAKGGLPAVWARLRRAPPPAPP